MTLVCLFVAWSLILWGASAASGFVRIVVAVVFLLANASFGVPTSIEVGDALALRIGPTLIKIGHVAAPALLAASAMVSRSERWRVRVRAAVRALALVALAMVFLTHLWVHAAFVSAGFEGGAQLLVAGAITEIDGFLLPLVYVSGLLVIGFAFDVAEGVALSSRRAAVRLTKVLLALLVVIKLWVQLFSHLGEWAQDVSERPFAAARTLASLALLAAGVVLVARLRDRRGFDAVKDKIMYGSGVILALDVIALVLVVGAGLFVLAQLDADEVPWFVRSFPSDDVGRYGKPIVAVAAIATGLWLVRRDRKRTDQELGSAMVLIGAWALPSFLLDLTDLSPGFISPLLDVGLTLGIGVYVACRWRTITRSEAVVLGTITVFAWLVITKGDWITVIGSMAGLPSVFVIVFGIVYSLASDALFTRTGAQGPPHGLRPFVLRGATLGTTNHVPRAARPLLFVGYLILSVTILNWIVATHGVNDQQASADTAFFQLGIPWAAWLIARRLLSSGAPDPDGEALSAQDVRVV